MNPPPIPIPLDQLGANDNQFESFKVTSEYFMFDSVPKTSGLVILNAFMIFMKQSTVVLFSLQGS